MSVLSDNTPSLRNRLVLTISISLLLVWGLVAWFAYDKGLHEAEELMDGQLALSARLLDGQISHEENLHPDAWYPRRDATLDSTYPALIENLDPAGRLPYEQELAFQIWTINGVLKLQSSNARGMERIMTTGYQLQTFNDQLWRVYTKSVRNDQYMIQVAHPVTTRDQIGLDVAGRATLPLFFAFPFLLLLVVWATRRSLRPLDAIAHNLTNRSMDELDPVLLSGVPEELVPIIQAFNLMLDRVRVSIQNERRFTSNAAHELRTPLAGVKLYAQLAQAATDPQERARFIEQVLKGIGRSERLVEQMLRLARLDPDNADLKNTMEIIDIRTLLLEVQDVETINTREKNQKIQLILPTAELTIRGHHDLLMVALSNLIGNASRYSPSHTTLTLGCRSDETELGLFVLDQGPGIGTEELPTITQRFKRGKDVIAEGSGLGLAIVERIANIHGARLFLSNLPQAGLRAELIWKK